MPYQPRLERWLGRLTGRLGLNDIHLVSSFDVAKTTDFADADLIDVHCLHSGSFSYLALPGLTANKPSVFTFHDMWPITGHCHASLECERWKTGCGKCPHPEVHPEIRRDATALEWRLKQWAYGKSKFTIVTPSRWLHDRTQESMLQGVAVHHIPHGIDTDVFRPIDKELCRSLLGIPKGKRVLICALESMRRPLKGADLLVQALQRLPPALERETVLLLFGQTSPEILRQIQMPVFDLGFLHNDPLKALAFSAADLFINPTRAESFGLVVLESMACGTPVLCFEVGGLPELVRPGVTGLLAPPFRPEGLSAGVCELLGNPGTLEVMARQCREVSVAEYSLHLQVQRYLKLYKNVIDAS
jgi:glycosyltransferase involved in cell wall biosynthesis